MAAAVGTAAEAPPTRSVGPCWDRTSAGAAAIVDGAALGLAVVLRLDQPPVVIVRALKARHLLLIGALRVVVWVRVQAAAGLHMLHLDPLAVEEDGHCRCRRSLFCPELTARLHPDRPVREDVDTIGQAIVTWITTPGVGVASRTMHVRHGAMEMHSGGAS